MICPRYEEVGADNENQLSKTRCWHADPSNDLFSAHLPARRPGSILSDIAISHHDRVYAAEQF